MDRREVLKRSSLILGYALTAGTATAILNGCKAEPALDWKPKKLSTDQFNLVSEISEMIIPKTDTPGAKDAKVDRFIDSMLEAYSPNENKLFLDGLKEFEKQAKKLHKKNFVDCSVEQRVEVMDAMVAGSKKGDDPTPFELMREATVVGFCTSEIGAKEFLKYDPVPGPYQGCVDYKTVGGTWAL